jgi:hypothetical protein
VIALYGWLRSLNIKLGQLCKQVKDNMCNSFLDFWNGKRVDAIGSNRGIDVDIRL